MRKTQMVCDMKIRSFIIVCLLSWGCALGAQEHPDSVEPPHIWRALGELGIVNGTIHAVNRFVMNESYAKTNLHSIGTNLTSGFTWDSDNFQLNQLGHSCQGTLFYNAARSNGMNFWQSLPFALTGSLVWEMMGENESPSINDLITTTVAGAAMGETAHRLAARIIREHEQGPRRFIREVSAALIDPAGGITRLLTGRAWKVKSGQGNTASEAEDDSDAPRLMVGACYLAVTDESQAAHPHPFFAFTMDYGQAADGERHDTPYDFFSAEAALTFGKGQPLVSHIQVTGRLCSMPIVDSKKVFGDFGLYQYFAYDDSRLPDDSAKPSPFPYGEMASVGPGVAFVFPRLTSSLTAEQRFFAKGVALGASKSDYYKMGDRDYNFGSGYGAAMMSRLTWQRVGMLQLDANYLHLFTWNNRLGDNSNTRLFNIGLKARVGISRLFSLMMGASLISRHSYYHQYPSRRVSCYELKAALQYAL